MFFETLEESSESGVEQAGGAAGEHFSCSPVNTINEDQQHFFRYLNETKKKK